MRTAYPRTPHLPWSPGVSTDDVRAGGLGGFVGREVVVTEKLDGENTTLYADGLHARSVDSAHHPSRAWVKALQGRVGARIPAGWRVCGENMYARHSLPYDSLDGYFYGFSVWDARDRCLGWDETVRFLRGLGVPVPPVLWRGVFDERALRRLRVETGRQEGFVVRTVEGFARAEFAGRVAKWVRSGHVTTDTHWMHSAVVANGLGSTAPLWAVRSGAAPDAEALAAYLGEACPGATASGDAHADPGAADRSGAAFDAVAAAEVAARLDGLGRGGDARLAGVLAALLHRIPRARLLSGAAGTLGVPLARRVADLVGLHGGLQRPYPDGERRAGLVRMSFAADLGVLHAVAGTVAGDDEAREQVEWSALHAQEAGLLGEAPLGALRSGLREALESDGIGGAAADRCWAETREAYARGRVGTVAEAVAATWRWRGGESPRLVQFVGPSGSGKSAFAARLEGVSAYVSLDGLREARGDRADQKANGEVLREGLDRLDRALADGAGRVVVWDATSLNPHQRSLVHAVARRRDALVTHAVLVTAEDELVRRNAGRAHPVPAGVLAGQLRRFVPPYPGQAHRTWYVGADGTVQDRDGTLEGEDA
ncbi:RNA ligase family protein [Streptomyces sp. DSM 15324]|uniref:RNA ligase family protein n=1 Tax=Streptomyces sp. DSM 15324 TaxID=1739111 RepID=UPI000748A592|nr:RNA ligase family protein [Streptomyces sp. DSM 15324]KUO09588.1 kinase [Streptomyces sp. DSM 15324]